MTHTVVMPDLGQTVAEGKIVRWLKKPGDKVSRGEYLLEVETDKVTMEVEAYVSGYLREILAEEGTLASAMAPIAVVTDELEEPYERAEHKAEPAAADRIQPQAPSSGSPTPRSQGLAAAPAAKALARELGIDLNSVPGTGSGGLITRKDVEQFAAGRTVSEPRAAMATLVTRSLRTIPHFYLTADVDMSAAESWREQWNAAHPELPATLNDIFVRAASQALRDVPGLNVSYHEGRYEPRTAADVLLVVAVDPGLALVPLSDPGCPPWEEFLRNARMVLVKAKQGRIAESSAGISPPLAISNLGMFRVQQFAAIIPPSCTAILAVGAVRDAAVVSNKQVEVGRVTSLTLSADHRVVDGVTAAKFMEKIQEHLNSL